MVAAAKLRKAQENILSARPYAYRLGALIKHIANNEDARANRLIRSGRILDKKKVLVVVVTADRSLCGAFNSNILRRFNMLIQDDFKTYYDAGDLSVVTVGRKGDEYFAKRDFHLVGRYTNFFNHMSISNAVDIVSTCVKQFVDGDADEVYVLYNEFKSAIQQNLVLEKLLPVEPENVESEDHKYHLEADYIYEPSQYEIINTLIPRHLNVQMWRILLESFAAEMGARMTAMDSATENAGELIDSLVLFYNRARQAAITKEILEVVSGAEALQK